VKQTAGIRPISEETKPSLHSEKKQSPLGILEYRGHNGACLPKCEVKQECGSEERIEEEK
jgi:hypothetical protein